MCGTKYVQKVSHNCSVDRRLQIKLNIPGKDNLSFLYQYDATCSYLPSDKTLDYLNIALPMPVVSDVTTANIWNSMSDENNKLTWLKKKY